MALKWIFKYNNNLPRNSLCISLKYHIGRSAVRISKCYITVIYPFSVQNKKTNGSTKSGLCMYVHIYFWPIICLLSQEYLHVANCLIETYFICVFKSKRDKIEMLDKLRFSCTNYFTQFVRKNLLIYFQWKCPKQKKNIHSTIPKSRFRKRSKYVVHIRFVFGFKFVQNSKKKKLFNQFQKPILYDMANNFASHYINWFSISDTETELKLKETKNISNFNCCIQHILVSFDKMLPILPQKLW